MPPTRSAYRRVPSLAPALFLVVVRGVEVDRTEQLGRARLLAAADVLLERLGNRLFFRRAAADFQRLVEQLVVQGEVGGYLHIMPTHDVVWRGVCDLR
jgi:hypothetical protein